MGGAPNLLNNSSDTIRIPQGKFATVSTVLTCNSSGITVGSGTPLGILYRLSGVPSLDISWSPWCCRRSNNIQEPETES